MTKKPDSNEVLTRPRWTPKEVAILKRLYPNKSNSFIADRLGKLETAVIFKAFRLGLKKSERRLRVMGRENIKQRWGNN
jgi:hypothetical protein